MVKTATEYIGAGGDILFFMLYLSQHFPSELFHLCACMCYFCRIAKGMQKSFKGSKHPLIQNRESKYQLQRQVLNLLES